jgi:hypothetical protein
MKRFRIKVSHKDNDYITYTVESPTMNLKDIGFVLNNEHYDFLMIEDYCFNKKKIISIEQY